MLSVIGSLEDLALKRRQSEPSAAAGREGAHV